MLNSLQINKFNVSVVALCDSFYSRFKRFFDLKVFFNKIDFSLKNKLHAYFCCFFFVVFLYGISYVQFF